MGKSIIECADCGATKTLAGRGLCASCYYRAQRAGTLGAFAKGGKRTIVTCVACGEERILAGRGLCYQCYGRHRRSGTLDSFTRTTTSHLNWTDSRVQERKRCIYCDAPQNARGLCGVHYQRAKKAGVLDQHSLATRISAHTCAFPDCPLPIHSRNWCRKHYARVRDLARIYHITIDDYLQMLDAQGGRCGICGHQPADPWDLVVDHDHVTGAVRGLLCGTGNGRPRMEWHGCNSALGYFRDRADLLRKAADWVDNSGLGASPTAAPNAAVGTSDGGTCQHQAG